MTMLARIAGALLLAAAALAAAAGARADAISAALARGDADAARRALEATLPGRADADLQRAMLEGLIALRAGEAEKAAAIFRAILAAEPGYRPARMQLSLALLRLGDGAEAMTHARRLGASEEARRLRATIAAAIARDRAARPAGVALRFSLLPSSNVTGGTRARTVTIGGLPFAIDPASREASGIGLNLGLTAWRTWELGRDWRATLSGTLDRRLYDTALRPDETEAALALGFAWAGPRTSLTFGPMLEALFQDGELARRRAGLSLALDHAAGNRLRFRFAADLLDQDFPGAAVRDGRLSTVSAGLSWRATPRVTLSLGLSGERETARAPHLAHRDLGLGLGLTARLAAGPTVGIELFRGRDRYDGDYPGFGVARRDDITSLRLSFSDPRIGWRGLTPEISVTRKRQSSNIPLHDTWTTDVGLNLVTRF